MAVGDLYSCTIMLGQGIDQWSSSYHYRQIAGVDDFDSANEACLAFLALAGAELQAVLNDQTSFFRIEWHTVTGANRIPGSWVSATGNVGTVIDQPAPLNLAVVMRLKTDAPRGQANGRLFISGFGELQMFDGQLSLGALTDFNTLGASLATNLASAGLGDVIYEPVVISRYEFGEKRPTPVGFNVLTVETQQVIYNQRTRKRKSTSLSYTLGG